MGKTGQFDGKQALVKLSSFPIICIHSLSMYRMYVVENFKFDNLISLRAGLYINMYILHVSLDFFSLKFKHVCKYSVLYFIIEKLYTQHDKSLLQRYPRALLGLGRFSQLFRVR